MIIMIGHSPNMFAMPTLWLLHRLNATYPIIYEISGPYFGKNMRFLVHYWPKINCKGLQLSKCFSYAMFTNYDRWARGEKRYSLRDKSQCTHPSQSRWFDKGILDRKGWRSGDPSITRISLYLPCYKWFIHSIKNQMKGCMQEKCFRLKIAWQSILGHDRGVFRTPHHMTRALLVMRIIEHENLITFLCFYPVDREILLEL